MSRLESDKLREFLQNHVNRLKSNAVSKIGSEVKNILQNNMKELSKYELSVEESNNSMRIGIVSNSIAESQKINDAEKRDGAFSKAKEFMNDRDFILKLLEED